MNLFQAMVLSLLLFTGCQVNRDFQRQLTTDFSGVWLSESENVFYEESWDYKEERLKGIGLIYNDIDTLFVEQLQIVKKFGGWFYAATIADQNNGKTVSFKLERPATREYIFSNKRHDFPQTISYTFNQDTAFVQINGEENGNLKSENLRLIRSTMRVP